MDERNNLSDGGQIGGNLPGGGRNLPDPEDRERLPRLRPRPAEEEICSYEVVEDEPVTLLDYAARYKWIVVAAMVVLALVSAIPLRTAASSPETYAGTIETLDRKKDTVLALTAASAATSAAISAVPGDAGTPIAEKLMDLSADFLIVLAAIYLEKYLLTTLGFASFAILFPFACALVVAAVLMHGRFAASGMMARVAGKLALLGVVFVITVPASVALTNSIEATFDQSITQTVEEAEGVVEEAEKGGEESEGNLLDWIAGIPESVGKGVSAITTGAQDLVNNFIESLAVMLVTSCVIPILVLVFFLWVANLVLGINVDAPLRAVRPRTLRGRAR